MAEIKAGVLLSLRDKFSSKITGAARRTKQFTSGVAGGLQKLDNKLSGVAAKFAGLAGGITLAGAAKGVIDLDARLTRLGTQANVSGEQVSALKKEIFAISQDSDIKVNPDQILGAIEQIIERTGDLKFAKDNIKSIGMAIQATGADGDAIGGIMAEFQKMEMSPKAVLKTIDLLTKQGKEGAFTLQNLASLGPRVISAYSATGRAGYEGAKEMGAVLQMIRMGTGSSEQAATAFEALMRNITDPKKQKDLKKLGVAVKDNAGNFKPVNVILKDIVKKSKGSIEAIGQIFDAEAVRAFNSALAEYKRTGGNATLDKFMGIQGDGRTIMKDSARNAKTMAANLISLKTAFMGFADRNLSGPITEFADALNKVKPEQLQKWMDWAKNIGIGLIALKGAAGGIRAVQGVRSLMNRPGKTGAGGGIGGNSLGAQPVYVTNWQDAGKQTNTPGGSPAGASRDIMARGGLSVFGQLSLLLPLLNKKTRENVIAQGEREDKIRKLNSQFRKKEKIGFWASRTNPSLAGFSKKRGVLYRDTEMLRTIPVNKREDYLSFLKDNGIKVDVKLTVEDNSFRTTAVTQTAKQKKQVETGFIRRSGYPGFAGL